MDQYTKGEVLGKGTFGVVIKATHKQVSLGMSPRRHDGMLRTLSMRSLTRNKVLRRLNSCNAATDRAGGGHQEDQPRRCPRGVGHPFMRKLLLSC